MWNHSVMAATATTSKGRSARTASGSGSLFAIAAYGLWGFAPIYWKQLEAVPATEVLAYRVIGSLIFAALLLPSQGGLEPLRAALRPARARWLVTASALLLGCNWWLFIWAVNTDRILDTSFGYYLTPLVNVAIGLTVFRERLGALQWVAVALAATAVGYLAWDLGGLPWISLALGGSFALYGALRKYGDASSIGGFVAEMAVLVVPAAAYLALRYATGEGALQHLDTLPPGMPGLLAGVGVVTATPLLCFASAAKRLPLTTVGFFQYIAPTLSLGVAIWLYSEPFTRTHAISFALIWSALCFYTWDSLARRR